MKAIINGITYSRNDRGCILDSNGNVMWLIGKPQNGKGPLASTNASSNVPGTIPYYYIDDIIFDSITDQQVGYFD